MSELRRSVHAGYDSPLRNKFTSSTQTQTSHTAPTHFKIDATPSTPTRHRPRVSLARYDSPSTTPSISSSVPFDWDAARNRKPPPYGSPMRPNRLNAMAKSAAGSDDPVKTKRKAVIRKKSLKERITSIPSKIAFQISMFPHNIPLPAPTTSAHIAATSLHFLHLCVRISQNRTVPDSELAWQDLYRDQEDRPWLDWTTLATFFLFGASIINTLYLFSRVRIYRLHKRGMADTLASPRTKFVKASSPVDTPTSSSSYSARAWRLLVLAIRFLLNIRAKPDDEAGGSQGGMIQQMEVWQPGQLEESLFALYSPVHALLWTATHTANWIVMMFVMGVLTIQLQAMTHAYRALLKDREIIAAEVMHEYNEGFVYPRVNPIRHDVAVMTHQSELVNVWDDQ